jgi:hypothetical protein
MGDGAGQKGQQVKNLLEWVNILVSEGHHNAENYGLSQFWQTIKFLKKKYKKK